MSIFLMGCYDPKNQMWCTVTKCAGGHDDATLARLQKELDMVKISKVRGGSRTCAWLGQCLVKGLGKKKPFPLGLEQRRRLAIEWKCFPWIELTLVRGLR